MEDREKKVVVINCFETFEKRAECVKNYFKSKGNQVVVIQSDFCHFTKTYLKNKKMDYIYIKTKPYYKNFSLKRLVSHYYFSKNAIKMAERLKPDILYILLPPNSLAKFSVELKRRHSNIKLVFDIIDIWPEAMPIKRFKNLFPIKIWADFRNNGLKYSDYVITECNLFQDRLKRELKNIKCRTVYLYEDSEEYENEHNINKNVISFLYLGSINNIIDIDKIVIILKKINDKKTVNLHIIGDGERKLELIECLENEKITYIDHGVVYEENKKQEIYKKCDYGINIMKDTVCVGLTMKSIDYFKHQLPIINNIKHDTKELVEKYNIGINVCDDIDEEKVKNIIEFVEEDKRKNVLNVYKKYFSREAFYSKMDEIYNEII